MVHPINVHFLPHTRSKSLGQNHPPSSVLLLLFRLQDFLLAVTTPESLETKFQPRPRRAVTTSETFWALKTGRSDQSGRHVCPTCPSFHLQEIIVQSRGSTSTCSFLASTFLAKGAAELEEMSTGKKETRFRFMFFFCVVAA